MNTDDWLRFFYNWPTEFAPPAYRFGRAGVIVGLWLAGIGLALACGLWAAYAGMGQ